MFNNSDENANDSSEIDSVVDAADVGEFIVLLLAVVQETQNKTDFYISCRPSWDYLHMQIIY